jgi:molybdate transport system ATP-binding protein
MVESKNHSQVKRVLHLDVALKRNDFQLEIHCQLDHLITGVFGISGAGKTTLMHVIAGIESPQAGVVELSGRELINTYKNHNLAIEKRHVGYVFQDGRLFPHLNIRQNLEYGVRYRKGNMAKIKFEALVSLLNIGDILDKKVKSVSGGQRQRVALGRSLMTEPDMLLLDEPFAGLDQPMRLQIIPYLKKIAERFHVPMLVVSHDLPDLLRLTDHLMVVHDGRCLGTGSPFELIGIPDAYNLLNVAGMINCLDLTVQKIDEAADLLLLSCPDCSGIVAECTGMEADLGEAQRVQATLRPEDITLALHRIVDISIQNQIKGRIVELKRIDRKVYCLINCGFSIMAELTTKSAKTLELKEGAEIWCLFKAAAVKINRLD